MILMLKKIVTSYLILVFLFSIMIVICSLIPSSLLKENIGKSLITLKQEDLYETSGFPFRPILLDNYTDSVMLNIAYAVDSKRPIWSAFVNMRFGKTNTVNQITILDAFFNNDPNGIKYGYYRYWHGYLIFLRPLLLFFTYSHIRIIITLALYIAFIYFALLSLEKLGKKATVYFIVGLAAVDFFSVGKSMQYFSAFFIAIAGSIYALRTYKKDNHSYILFFVTGSLTSFFDLLTAPLVALGMLLITITLLEKKNNIVPYSAFWLLGYLLLWSSKWIIVQLFYSQNALASTLNQIVFRAVGKVDSEFSQFNAVRLNILQLIGYDWMNRIILTAFLCLAFIVLVKYFSFNRSKLKSLMPWITIFFIPYGWYLITANHSYVHTWFAYRSQFMSVLALLMIYDQFIDWPKFAKDIRAKVRKFWEK